MTDWSDVSLGELVELRKGVKVDVFEHDAAGRAPYLGASALEGGQTLFASTKGAVLARPNDLLMLWDGERSGLVGSGLSGVVASTTARLRPRGDVSPEFLRRSLEHRFAWIQARRTGTGVPHVPRDLSTWLRLRVPDSVKEQQQIAAVLDSIDDQIVLTKRIVAKLSRAKQGMLHDLLTGGAEPADARPSATRPGAGVRSREWSFGQLGQWCERATVGVVNSATQAYVDDGVPFIRSQNVKPGYIDLRGMLHIRAEYNRVQSASILRAGDVVVVRTGYPGTAAVVPEVLAGANCFSLLVVTPDKRLLSSDFLVLYLNSEICKREIGTLHFGSAQHNLNLAELKRLSFFLPPLDEQRRIVAAAHAADTAIVEEGATIGKLRLLRAALSADLLTGLVRVPSEEVQ